MNISEKYHSFIGKIPSGITLVAVSKTKSVGEIMELYEAGHRDFGENYVQELLVKQTALPGDIRWHFIGHLQSNKVKNIAPFIHLVHSADSFSLLKEINKEGAKNKRVIRVLMQTYIGREETKYGLSPAEIMSVFENPELPSLRNIRICGLMAMGTNTDDLKLVASEFAEINQFYEECKKIKSENIDITVLSMGMSGDYQLAIDHGSNMIRIGSLIFGERNYKRNI